MEGESDVVTEKVSQQSQGGVHLTHQICREVAWERSAFVKQETAAQENPRDTVLGEVHQNLPPSSPW